MKKIFIFAGSVVILLGVAGLVVFSRARQPAGPQNGGTKTAQLPTPTSVPSEIWRDPAGFTFEYPKGISVNPHAEDNENYAHLELTHAGNPGTVFVWAKDTTAQSIGDWVKKEKRFADAAVIDTTMGGAEAKKILQKTPSPAITVAAISDRIVFSIEGTFESSDFWQKTFDRMATSFAFVPPEGESSGKEAVTNDSPPSDNVSADEEEVVE